MKQSLSILNIIFVFSLIGVVLIALGIIPRQIAFLIVAAYLIFVIFSPLEKSLLLFARSIPFFIALPLSSSFDNFNTWRIVLLVIFAKWFFPQWKSIFSKLRKLSIKDCWRQYKIECLGFVLLILAFISLFGALDVWAGAKRIIYFLNLAMIFAVVSSLVSKNKKIFKPLMKNIALSGILIAAFGCLQLASVFFMSIDVFQHWWGEQISLGFYGQDWSEIVMEGNTWFSYSGGSLKLRMFSTFPDSHSFPLYILMTLPALLVILAENMSLKKLSLEYNSLKDKIKKFEAFFQKKVQENRRLIDWIIFLILANFALILTGTRGIWLSAIFPIILIIFLFKRFPRFSVLIALSLLIFVLFFWVAPFFYALPQFQLAESPSGEAFIERMLSTLSLTEISNQGRILIWRKTLQSLVRHPWIGVGIGNFPVVLNQSTLLAKAGSSAHNLYLHIAAEMGLIALLVFFWLMMEIFKRAWSIFKQSAFFNFKIFALSSIVFLIWVLAYSFTDAALCDERAFLILMLVCGTIIGLNRYEQTISIR